MANDVKVKINSTAARQILNSGVVQGELLKRAQRIKSSADSMGAGTVAADVRPGKNRAHALVKTTDHISKKSNAKHNTLLKSMDAGK